MFVSAVKTQLKENSEATRLPQCSGLASLSSSLPRVIYKKPGAIHVARLSVVRRPSKALCSKGVTGANQPGSKLSANAAHRGRRQLKDLSQSTQTDDFNETN